MWIQHWELCRDPFPEADALYVPLPGHDEAVARIVYAIESGSRRITLRADEGLGKSAVMARALAEARRPGSRIARVSGPLDAAELFGSLAEALGVPARRADRARAWRALGEAVRLCRWQALRVVLAIDDAQTLDGTDAAPDLERLDHLMPGGRDGLTVVRVGRTSAQGDGPTDRAGWELTIRLPALTRTESEHYLRGRLVAAGRVEGPFTPRAIDALHRLSEGRPRGLNRLAGLSLMAGAARGLEMVDDRCVVESALECGAPA